MSLKAIVINAKDNLANMVGKGSKGDQIACIVEDGDSVIIELLDDIPRNHKFAFVDITKGDNIVKYGQNMGRASKEIKRGEYAHVHNIESNRGRGDL